MALKMKVKVALSCPTLWDPVNYTVHSILQDRILNLSNFQGIFPTQGQTQISQVDSLPAEPPGKPKNTGVASLSVFQRIFPIQESNQGLLHCRWILYQLSYQGSIKPLKSNFKSLYSMYFLISPPVNSITYLPI